MSDAPRKKTGAAVLAEADAAVGEAYSEFRKAVFAAGPLDRATADIAVLGAFVAIGSTQGVRVHGGRMYREGTSIEALRQMVMVCLGQAANFGQVTAALKIIDEFED